MKQAMILAAGMGTRLKPITDRIPKALVSVGEKPLLDRLILRLRAQGYQRFVVNVHHLADQIERHIEDEDSYGVHVIISDERQELLETGGALKKAAPFFDDDEPILIHNVDILDNVDYNWLRLQHLDDEDAVLLVSRRKTNRYLLFDNAMRLMGWVNIATGELRSPFDWVKNPDEAELDMDNYRLTIMRGTTKIVLNLFAFSGIHSFSPRLFPLMERFPDRFPILDFYLQTCHRTRIYGLNKPDLRLLDVGKLDSLQAAEEFLKQ
ncbi:MAG: NTP transferase domain-containing protein [Prevotella sp.]|nr:NTP transferase domain-containing protein [Prevotella sp.]